MGVITRLLERRGGTFMEMLLANRGAALETATGRSVTALGSLQSTAVFGAVRVLAESVASLPLIVYRREGRSKRRAENHQLYPLLHDLPNPEMTSIELRETLMGHLALWGNAYCEVQRDRGGRVMGLWPLRPDRVEVQRDWGGELIYQVMIGDPLEHNPEQVTLPKRLVMHLRGLGYDGVKGYSPIAMARQAIGLALATEEFGARFFGNGARPGAVLEHPGVLGDKAHDRLKNSWNMRHQGLDNAHRIAILEEGMKLHEVGIPPEDAQFLETRKFQVSEIARLFRVPPHMLADLERSTNNNIEHQGLEFVMHTLRPWLVRWEQAIKRDLLTPAERTTYYAEHLIDGLLRGDIQARYASYAQGRQNGWLSANDIREMENLNPVDGGDVYLVPLNMIPAEQAAAGTAGVGEPAPADSGGNGEATPSHPPPNRGRGDYEARARGLAVARSRLAGSYARIFEDAAGRVIRREVADVRRAITKYLGKRSADDFRDWLAEFYLEHRQFWVRQLLPIVLAYAEQVGIAVGNELGQDPLDTARLQQFIDEYLATLAERQSIRSEQALRTVLAEALEAGEEPVEALEAELSHIEETRPASVARWESSQVGNAVAKAFYGLAGVVLLRWVATGDTCPYCRDLDGRVVGIQEFFLRKDTNFLPEGAERPIRRRSNVGHPPLHDGCDCQIVASL